MRAVWAHALPALSRHFGIHPWDVERLTADELDRYLEALAHLLQQVGDDVQ